MNIEIIKAIFAAGFRLGKHNGEYNAIAYERGTTTSLPQTAEEAWKEDIEWRLAQDSSYKLDINNPEHWFNI